ncbi:hypothetical protein [Burkholderia ambifaria]|jgi:hypothetical protein|uniref:hypothetical protein n=1 Tax=Burkholderia ambifaria TaxID=152480 RepID=UPI00158C1960|nr:hypothetical protein [Burkholderia ambifaria]
MAFVDPTQPNLADFTTFVYNQGVPETDLPTDSQYLQWAFTMAMNLALQSPCSVPAIVYVLAVYNLGMHRLLKVAQDTPPSTYFATQRANFKMLSFVAGVVQSAGDQGTSNSLIAPDFLKNLTMQDLDLLKTPWGREYLAYAQQYGPDVVGVS